MFEKDREVIMRLLRVEFDNVCVFEENRCAIVFYAQDKVPSSDESVTLLGRPVYSNNVIAIAGVTPQANQSRFP